LTSAATSWAAIRSLLRIFVIAVTLNAAVAVCAFIAHFSPLWLNYGSERVSGMLLDPNAFGGLLMVAVVLQGVTQQGGQPLIEGVPGWIASVILAVGLILTLSRSAWMGLGLAVVVIALARPKRVVLWGALALLAVGAVYLILGQESGSRELALAQRENTAMQRVDQVRQGWAMFSEHPILGAGLGAFDRDKDPGTPHATLIHNTSIWMLSEFGLMGLTVFAGFMLWFILRGREALRLADPAAQPLILALISAHVGMLGVSAGIEALYQRHWWLVMAMLASSWVLARNNKRRFLVFRGGRR
jgi:O-antigen ligase